MIEPSLTVGLVPRIPTRLVATQITQLPKISVDFNACLLFLSPIDLEE